MICLATQDLPEIPKSDQLLREALHADVQVWSDPRADWSRYEAVVVRSCWDYHLRAEEFRAWIDRVPVSLINSADLIRWNLDKRYLQEFGDQVPETIWLEDPEATCDIADVCRDRGWQAAVVKPFISASAHRTEKLSQGIVKGPAMVQCFRSEIRERGEWSLLYFGGVFSHAILKRPAAGDFRVQKEFGGSYAPADPPPALIAFGLDVLRIPPEMPVIARVDVLAVDVLEHGPWLMELEIIEPELFLTDPDTVARAAAAIRAAVIK